MASPAPTVSEMVNTVQQYHMNQAAEIVPDERDFLRPWRSILRAIVADRTAEFMEFLDKPLEAQAGVPEHMQFLSTIAKATGAVGSSWASNKIIDAFDPMEVLGGIEAELGEPIESVRGKVHKVLDLYQKTIGELFEASDELFTKVRMIDRLHTRLEDFPMEGPPSKELDALRKSIVEYVHHIYDSNKIDVVYKDFCTLYAKFSALRPLVFALQVAGEHGGAPCCSICTHEKISYVLTPCGHAFCNSCVSKQRSQCFICRCAVHGKQRVYFN